MPNLELIKKKKVSNFRKIALGTWQRTYDPSVYGTMDIRMDDAVRYVAEFREKTGRRLTVSHLVAKAVAMALKECPDANAVLRWNRIYLRKVIGVFFQVAMTDEGSDKIDLSGLTLYDVDQKAIADILDEFEEKVEKVRKREDPVLEKTRNTFQVIPYLLLNVFLKTLSFLTIALNLDLRWAGIPKDPLGSVMVTNVGSLGLDVAYVPLVPYSGVPILLAMGEVADVPIVEDGEIKAAKIMRLNATFDHRVIDGFHAAVLAKVLRKWLQNPYEMFGEIPETKD
jgi:pyruvate/2-oxoglutarate dehydrogenase complex dihydrolipoamide acyltransferase (E2) component